jgi:hypothetical protein
LALALFILTLRISIGRWRNPNLFHSPMRLFYIGEYLVSFALVSVLGFLGGVILYGFHEVPIVPITGGVSEPTQVVDPAASPTAELAMSVSFEADIMPIMNSRCTNCHGGQEIEEDLDLTSYERLMKGSKNGPAVSPGDATNSILFQLITHLTQFCHGATESTEKNPLFCSATPCLCG